MEQLDLPFSKNPPIEEKNKKKIFDDILYIKGDVTDRDGTTEDIPIFQTEEGKWKIGKKEATAREIILTAGRKLPADVYMQLNEEVKKEKERARKNPIN